MINLLKTIVSAITAVFGFFIHFITSMLNFLTHVPVYVGVLGSLIANLPSVIIPFATASVSISVILWILNRRTNA